jgi:hypothetical protein
MQRFVKQPIRAMHDSWIYQRAIRGLANQPLIDIAVKYRGRSGLVKITDDNMATEYRRTPLTGGTTWFSFLEKVWLSG